MFTRRCGWKVKPPFAESYVFSPSASFSDARCCPYGFGPVIPQAGERPPERLPQQEGAQQLEKADCSSVSSCFQFLAKVPRNE
jgi:hypothetical protein